MFVHSRSYFLYLCKCDNLWLSKIGDNPTSSEVPVGEYPYRVTKDNGQTALCVQTAGFTKYLGKLTVTFDRYGDIVGWEEGNPILLDSTVPKGLLDIEPLCFAVGKTNSAELHFSKPISDFSQFGCRFCLRFVYKNWDQLLV